MSGKAESAVPDFSGTNTQEADVDEPDVIKTDGRRIFAVTDGTLRVIDAAYRRDHRTLKLDGNEHRLLLRGDRVLVISNKGASPTGIPSRRRSPLTGRRWRARRSSPRSTSRPRRRSCARWRSPAASSTRARTAAPPAW